MVSIFDQQYYPATIRWYPGLKQTSFEVAHTEDVGVFRGKRRVQFDLPDLPGRRRNSADALLHWREHGQGRRQCEADWAGLDFPNAQLFCYYLPVHHGRRSNRPQLVRDAHDILSTELCRPQ